MSIIKYYTHVKNNMDGTADFKIFKLPKNTLSFQDGMIDVIGNLPIDIDCAGEDVEVIIEPWIKLKGLHSNSYSFRAMGDIIRGDCPESSYTSVKMAGNYFKGIHYL